MAMPHTRTAEGPNRHAGSHALAPHASPCSAPPGAMGIQQCALSRPGWPPVELLNVETWTGHDRTRVESARERSS